MGAPRIVRSLSFSVVALMASAFAVDDALAQWTFRAAPQPLIRNISVFANNPVANTNTLIVSTLTDGMYKGTDTATGTTWQKISTGIPIVQVRAHTTVTTTDFYAATDGAGLYKTTNGGTNWSAINGSGATALGCLDVRSIAVPVTTLPRTLLVSTSCRNNSGVYRGIDDGSNPVTWTRLGPLAGQPFSLPADVQSSALNRSGTLYFLATANYGIFKSIDDGANWTTANSGIIGSNVFSTSFSGATGTAELLAYVHGSGIYRSIDTGASWMPSNSGLPANFAALGGINREAGQTLYIGLDKQGVYKTADGGLNWLPWGTTVNDESAAYTRTIVPNPAGAGRYYLGSLNGIVKTLDNASTLNETNMPQGGRINAITHDRDAPYAAYITVHLPFKINYIYGDYNNDALFTPLENGITGTTNDGVVYQDRLTPATLYVSTNNRGIFKSTNAGASFTAINNGLPNMIGKSNRLAIDPVNSQILYLGLGDAAGVYKSTDGGASWLLSSSGLTSPLALSINHLTVDGINPAIVWASTDAGLFKSTTSGASWTLMYSALDGALSTLPTGIVRVRPGNSNEIYLANNHANANGTLTTSSGILKSTNGGTSWTNILPDVKGSQVRVTTGGEIYAGVSAPVGGSAVYRSINGGTSFSQYSTNLLGTDIRTFGFAADDSALISLSLENGFYTNDAVPAPPSVTLSRTITEAPNNFLNLVFPPQIIGTISAPKSVTITNTGTTTANIIGFGIDNSDVFAVHSQNCTSGLAPGASCTVNVTCTPNVGADGLGSGGTLTVIGPVSGVSVQLRSFGVSPTLPTARLRQSPGAVPAYPDWFRMGTNFRELSFGNQTIGTSRTLSYTLTNYGVGLLNINSITVDNARFTLGGTCGATLAGGASCLVSFTYTPTFVGPDGGNVNITTDSAFLIAGNLNFSLTGAGETAGAEGSLVTTFGDNGRVFISTGPYGTELVSSLGHQTTDGKTLALLVARKIVDDGISIPAVARLNTDGTLDNLFGTGGIVRLPPPGLFQFDNGSSVFGVADDKILVSLNVVNAAGTANDTYIYRLFSSGVIDTSFGTVGSTVVPNLQHGIRLAPDGKIVLGGIDTTNLANNALIFTRLTADGAVDTSFGTNGRTDVLLVDAVASGQGFNLEVTADGKILYAYPYGAGAARDFAIFRLSANGLPDSTWGTAGRVNVAPTNREDNLRAIRLQSDGKILLLSRTARSAFPANQEFLLVRLNPDGTLDNSFGTGGIVETLAAPVVAGKGDFASALRVLADGKIIVSGRRTCSGSCGTGQDLVVLRYLSNGTLDPAFGIGGMKDVVLSRANESAHALDIDADGTIVIGGDIPYVDSDRGNAVGTSHVFKLKNTVGVALVNLTVSKVGTGSVTSSPAGIDCGGTCVASLAPGSMITLTATGQSGSTFSGWSGGVCTGTAPCTLTISAATTVTATFTGGAPGLVSALSRKVHGSAGTFDLPVTIGVPINGAITVEPRTIGTTGHKIVFQFDQAIASVGGVTAMVGAAAVGTASVVATGSIDVIVTLTGVPDNLRATISLTTLNSNGSANASVSMGFLVGDMNDTESVNASDISAVKARASPSLTLQNFKYDLNLSGAINAQDTSAVKARSGLVMP